MVLWTSNTFNSFKKDLKSIFLQNNFLYCRRIFTDSITVAGYIIRMFVTLCIVVVMWCKFTVECLCLTCAFYCYRWHGMYSIVTCPVLCNVTQLMQITKKCLHFPHSFNYVAIFMHNLMAKNVIQIY
jgi:hypothetical protein